MSEEAPEYPFDQCVSSQDWDGPYMSEDLIAAAIKTGGNFTAMAELLHRSRTGVYNACMSRPDVVQCIDEIKESRLDKIESIQFGIALSGDKQAGQYILDRQAKERGYTSRQETSGPNGGPVGHVKWEVSETTSPVDAARQYKELTGG